LDEWGSPPALAGVRPQAWPAGAHKHVSSDSRRPQYTDRAVGDSHTEPRFADAALVTIDTQRDVLEGGAIPIPGTSAALPAMRALLEAFRGAHRPIVHVVRLYERDAAVGQGAAPAPAAPG
jgi:hypothetical protein